MARTPLKFQPSCSSAYPLLIVGALAVASGVWQHSAAVAALGCVLLLGPGLLYLGLRRSVRSLRLHRWAPETAFEGESVEIGLEIENDSPLPLFFPQVAESFTPEIHAQKDLLFAGRVQPGESVPQSYRGQCVLPRGLYQLGPTAARVTDPFGFFEIRKFFGGRQSLKVYPQIHRIRATERLGECISEISRDLTRNVMGESNSYLSVREFRTGDSRRKIHWGLTAHVGYPVVRETERTATGNLNIVLDLHPLALIGWGRNSCIEVAVKIAASVSSSALRRGRSVQFFAGGNSDYFVPAGTGPGQLRRILDVLVRVRPYSEPGREAPALPEVLTQSRRRMKSETSILLMISPYLFGDVVFEGQLRSLRARRHRVAAVIFDGETFHHIWDPPKKKTNVIKYASHLRALGVEPYVVPCGAKLEAIFCEESR